MMNKIKIERIVESLHDGFLFRDYLRSIMQISRKTLAEIKFQGGELKVNEEVSTVKRIVRSGDCIKVVFPDENPSLHIKKNEKPLEICYEDNHLLVVNKEPGLLSIPSIFSNEGSLAGQVLFYYGKIAWPATFHPVTRLDKDTSGLLLIAKHSHAHHLLKKIEIRKEYYALVNGTIPFTWGTICEPIARSSHSIIERIVSLDGQHAITHFKKLDEFSGGCALALSLETGRTHQIRVHLSAMGYPLIGDELYGEANQKLKRHALHAKKLAFTHPFSGKKITVNSELPVDLNYFVKKNK